LLRPAVFLRLTTSERSGFLAVISEKSEPVICRREGVYGLYVLMPIVFSPLFITQIAYMQPALRALRNSDILHLPNALIGQMRPFGLKS
jgi:hypothetical protein